MADSAVQMLLFTHEAYSITLRCSGITGECRTQVLDENGATCTDDYYQLDVQANSQMYASVLVPAGKAVGAGGPCMKKYSTYRSHGKSPCKTSYSEPSAM